MEKRIQNSESSSQKATIEENYDHYFETSFWILDRLTDINLSEIVHFSQSGRLLTRLTESSMPIEMHHGQSGRLLDPF